MTRQGACAVVGKWRIIEADLWDRGYLGIETLSHHGDEANLKDHKR